MSDNEVNEEKPFCEDPMVHGVAKGLNEKYDISDDVYSMLVYGMTVPVDDVGDVCDEDEDPEAYLAIVPAMLPGAPPMPMEIPNLEGSDPYTIDRSAEELEALDIVAFWDEANKSTVTGQVVQKDSDNEKAVCVVGNGDEQEEVTVHTGGATEPAEINGTGLGGGFRMQNDDAEEEKGWWHVEEFDDRMGEMMDE